MILIAAQIDDFDVPNKMYKKQRVVTRPELSTVHKDLFSIILNMHGALQQIDRIDGAALQRTGCRCISALSLVPPA